MYCDLWPRGQNQIVDQFTALDFMIFATKIDQISSISSPWVQLWFWSLNDTGLEIQLLIFLFLTENHRNRFPAGAWEVFGCYVVDRPEDIKKTSIFYRKLITETGSHTFMYGFCLYKKELDSVFLFYFLSIPSFPIVLALRWAVRLWNFQESGS